MKSYKLNVLLAAGTLAIAASSCDDLMETHQKYLEGGEIIYAPKPDTVYFESGHNRVKINYEISKAPNVRELKATWNNGQDERTFPIEPVGGNATGAFYIENLPEKSYSFEVTLIDSYGHSSLPTAGFGRSYGDNYASTLVPLGVSSLVGENGAVRISWLPSSVGFQYNEIVYSDPEGVERTLVTDGNNETVISGFQPGESLRYRSAYLPEENCADLFFTDWMDSADDGIFFPHSYDMADDVDRTTWETLLCESVKEWDGQGVAGMLDGDRNTYWHSGYDDNRVDCPYAFVFDMKETIRIGRVGVMQRNGGYNFRLTGLDFYVSDDSEYAGNKDGNNWTLVASMSPYGSDDMQWQNVANDLLDAGVKGRFLKVVVTDTHDKNGIAAIAELSIQRVAGIDGNPMD